MNEYLTYGKTDYFSLFKRYNPAINEVGCNEKLFGVPLVASSELSSREIFGLGANIRQKQFQVD